MQLPVEEVTPERVRDFTRQVCDARGETILRVNVYDASTNVSVRLFSKSHKVALSPALVDYLEDNGIKYSIA